MYSLIALGAVIIVSAVVVKIGTVALRLTGLDEETAAFQALSAFTRTGFTTLEAERIVNHPHRRRIIKVLIVVGNAGIAVTIATLVASFSGLSDGGAASRQGLVRVAALVAFLALFYLLAAAKPVNRVLNRFIERRLTSATDLGFIEFQQILSLGGEYGISYVEIRGSNPIAGKSLVAAALSRAQILVLAIERKGANMPTPPADTVIEPGDRLVCYGKNHSMRVLAKGDYNPGNPAEEPASAAG